MYQKNRIKVLLARLSLIMFFFTLCRVFFLVYNHSSFSFESNKELLWLFVGGLKFDLTAVLYANTVFIIMSMLPLPCPAKAFLKIRNLFYYIPNSVFLLSNLMDAVYYPYGGNRVRWSFLDSFFKDTGALSILGSFILKYWYLSILGLLFCALLIFIFLQIKEAPNKQPYTKRNYITDSLRLLLVCGFWVIGIRGGAHPGHPLDIGDAVYFTKQNQEIDIVLNTPFTLLLSMGDKNAIEIKDYQFYPSSDSYSTIYSAISEKKSQEPFQKKNIVNIILEGIGEAFVSENMPFLDSLRKESLSFTNMYCSGGGSIQGINGILGGFPCFGNMYFMLSPYAGNAFDAAARLLVQEGYTSLFYCGCNKGSFSLENFARAAGYRNFVGREEYGRHKDYDGAWGIWDHKMAEYVLEDLNKQQQAFIAAWFTLTSHGPFRLPNEFTQNTGIKGGNLENTIKYVDYTLRDFFAEAKKSAWFKNTIFIITSDHSNQHSSAIYNTDVNRYKLPFIIYSPDGKYQGIDSLYAKQSDISASILHGLLGYPHSFISSGENILSPAAQRFAVNYVNNQFQILRDGYILQFDGKESTAFYHINTDPLLENNLIEKEDSLVKTHEKLLKAYLQDYSSRLRNNRMTINTKASKI